MSSIFSGLFDSSVTTVIEPGTFLVVVFCGLIIGLFLAVCYMYHSRYSKSFVLTLALLPAIVAVVIMMVNGNIGAGVAVAGAFSLVRFRSAAGSAKEIAAIFLGMATGLVLGMGYLAYAVLVALILGAAFVLYNHFDFGSRKKDALYKTLRITIPEDLDYTDVLREPLAQYCSEYELAQVKTTNMGSMFRLTYHLTLRSLEEEKALIDDLRCRNGNLEISVSRQETTSNEL